MRTTEMADVVQSETSRIADESKQIASEFSSTIADGITADVGFIDGQLVGRVNANDFKSHWFQFGTVKMAAHPFLDVAAVNLGYRLEATSSE